MSQGQAGPDRRSRGDSARPPRGLSSLARRVARFETALCATLTLAAGCLITEPIGFEVEQVPSHLSNPRPRSFIHVPPAADPACEVGFWMAFSVDLSDANLTESLEARLFINGRIRATRNIPPTGQLARDPLVMCARKIHLEAACNHVELVVTSEFANSVDLDEPRDPADFTKVEWWILSSVAEVPVAGQDDCSRLFDAGVP
jgi:hypothetical protein